MTKTQEIRKWSWECARMALDRPTDLHVTTRIQFMVLANMLRDLADELESLRSLNTVHEMQLEHMKKNYVFHKDVLQMQEVLDELEWSGWSNSCSGADCCPYCRMPKGKGHDGTCVYRKLPVRFAAYPHEECKKLMVCPPEFGDCDD